MTTRRAVFTSLCLAAAAIAPAASDYQWTFGDDGGMNFILNSVSDPIVYDDTIPAGNPTVNLIVGKRYGITVNDPTNHPLQIIANSGNFVTDTVLLAQGGASGTLEADAGINWVDGGGVIEFTVTSTLVDAMRAGGNTPGYRCELHPSMMRGTFDLFGAGVDIPNPIPTAIPFGSAVVELQQIATGFPSPIGMVAPDDSTGRFFIYDQNGEVSILDGGTVLPTPFLDVSARLVSPLGTINGININFDERGLLGMALHPDFDTNGKVYTYTSEPVNGTADFTTVVSPDVPDHQAVIAEWTVGVDPNVIDTSTRREVLRIDQPQFNHNSGQLAFGPDGFLYIGLGDGGAGDDEDGRATVGIASFGHGPNGNGQDNESILGSILRINVDGNTSTNGQYAVPPSNPFVGADGIDEIYAYGFRNPFRFSFDTDGTLYCADVGQHDIEEINTITSGGNYGWRLKEGSFFFDPVDPSTNGTVVTEPVAPVPPDVIDPIAEYDHDEGISIIGGFVYRGSELPNLVGKYIFGEFQGNDSGLGRLFYLDTGNEVKELQLGTTNRELELYIKGFGIDTDGEVYLFTSDSRSPIGNGALFKFVDSTPSSVKHWTIYE